MIDKHQLTEKLLGQLDIPATQENINKHFKLWWKNTRKDHNNSLRLTDAGYVLFTEKVNLLSYDIDFPEEPIWTNELLLRLDRFLESPYYIQKKGITVFREKTAVELILYGGDLQKYGVAKAKSAERDT